MTEKEQATEWQRRRNLNGVEVRYMNAGRCSDTQISLCGHDLGTKTTIYSRGKVQSVHYYLPEVSI